MASEMQVPENHKVHRAPLHPGGLVSLVGGEAVAALPCITVVIYHMHLMQDFPSSRQQQHKQQR